MRSRRFVEVELGENGQSQRALPIVSTYGRL
jgi:hypothetical protein